MAQIIYTGQALSDLERIFEFLGEKDPGQAADAVLLIRDAIKVLQRHPFIGRHAEHGRRELIISRGRTGYIALYRYLEGEEAVLILAIRHQREAGYQQE